ncbi:MAG TPA: LytTR family DNA-binding domain-containing protein [Pyrinomonadaceae bacterium]|nr:LytTR family DNA-binding domain-containing protein [Pyrinomonadaceae bacterium]
MQKIRAIIIDDEKPARRRLLDLLEKRPEVTVVGECTNGVDAVQMIQAEQPDLVFLDIQMPTMGGFEVIQQVGLENLPVTIFVTAFDAYAVRAFEVNALDYLLKPYSDERFAACLTKALEHIRTQKREEMSSRLVSLLEQAQQNKLGRGNLNGRGYVERLLIKVAGRVIFLATEDLTWIEAAGVYVQLHAGTKKYLHRCSLVELEKQLDPERFVRIHRSTIVNTASVKELYLQSHGDYTMILKDGTELKLSRSYRSRFGDSLRQAL